MSVVHSHTFEMVIRVGDESNTVSAEFKYLHHQRIPATYSGGVVISPEEPENIEAYDVTVNGNTVDMILSDAQVEILKREILGQSGS